jgi:hypothetical protein
MISASKMPGNRLNLAGLVCSPVYPSTQREGTKERVVDGDKGDRVGPVKSNRLTGPTVATQGKGQPDPVVMLSDLARRVGSRGRRER